MRGNGELQIGDGRVPLQIMRDGSVLLDRVDFACLMLAIEQAVSTDTKIKLCDYRSKAKGGD